MSSGKPDFSDLHVTKGNFFSVSGDNKLLLQGGTQQLQRDTKGAGRVRFAFRRLPLDRNTYGASGSRLSPYLNGFISLQDHMILKYIC